MTNINAFRPTLNSMEERSLMSASFAAPAAEPALLRVELENVFVSSAQPAPAANGNELLTLSGAGVTPQTREHILLARQVGVPAMAESAPYNHSNGGGNLGINVEPVAAVYLKYDGIRG